MEDGCYIASKTDNHVFTVTFFWFFGKRENLQVEERFISYGWNRIKAALNSGHSIAAQMIGGAHLIDQIVSIYTNIFTSN